MLEASAKCRVEVVIVNWRRPANIPLIIEGFRAQTLPCWITLCDVGCGEFRLPSHVLDLADSAFAWSTNHGSFNRYIPSFAFGHEFCWFHDDDMVPGSELISHMLSHEAMEFAVLGQTGRRIQGQDYSRVRANDAVIPADFVCRGYFVRTMLLHHVMRFKWEAGIFDDTILEDDILLAIAIRTYADLQAYVVPKPRPSVRMNFTELPAPFACHEMVDHYARRIARYHDWCRISKVIKNKQSGSQ